MAHGRCSGQASINFLILSLIRGTTPLMMWLTMKQIESAGLVIAVKSAVTCVLFLCSAVWQIARDDETKISVKKNLMDVNTYWKLFIIGVFQSAAPYMLATYSLEYFPPTMVGVFMVTTPWWSAIFERLPFIKKKTKMAGTTKIGMIFGMIGMVLIVAPIIKESLSCGRPSTRHDPTNTTDLPHTNSTSNSMGKARMYPCLSAEQIVVGLLSLLFAALLWGAMAVFWKFQKRDTHFLVSSVGQNFIGGVVAALVWYSAERHVKSDWHNAEAQVGFVYLGVATGWLATLLVLHLYTSLGPKTTNQVLATIPFIAFVEDCIFARDVITVQPWVIAIEILGLLVVSIGVFISNMSLTTNPSNRPKRFMRRDSLSEGLLPGSYRNQFLDGFDGYEDEASTTSGFYTSATQAGRFHANNKDDGNNDYSFYEPPPMFITPEKDDDEDEGERFVDTGINPSEEVHSSSKHVINGDIKSS